MRTEGRCSRLPEAGTVPLRRFTRSKYSLFNFVHRMVCSISISAFFLKGRAVHYSWFRTFHNFLNVPAMLPSFRFLLNLQGPLDKLTLEGGYKKLNLAIQLDNGFRTESHLTPMLSTKLSPQLDNIKSWIWPCSSPAAKWRAAY